MKTQSSQEDIKKHSKLEESELEKLKTLNNSLYEADNEIRNLCFQKEKQIRQDEADFNKRYAHLEVTLEDLNAKYKNLLQTLEQKYGKGSGFNLLTGEIVSPAPSTTNLKAVNPKETGEIKKENS